MGPSCSISTRRSSGVTGNRMCYADDMPLARKPATSRQLADLMTATKWADDLSPREVETFCRYLHASVAERGTVIVREGDREASLCLIASGQVSVSKASASGRSRRLNTAGPGRTFGEMSLIDGQPRSATVTADEPTTLLMLTKDDFAKLVEDVPRLAFKVLLKIARLTSQRLRQTSGALVDYLGGADQGSS